ncbi:nose resistant to fluoxetine protein 6-like [Zophobas morio]|uniref:nose resistant to fluoxetine protein 6-like n=1 Tax=Zophobas morio TaxID=2755281 RepID=UPI003083C3F3
METGDLLFESLKDMKRREKSNDSSRILPMLLLKNNLLGILYNDNLDKTCVSDLNALFSDASSFKHWALQMLDATGKIYPGLLNGNINLIGDYEECLAINESKNGRRISGKYCTLALTMGNSGISPLATSLKQGPLTTMTWGICVPKSCSVRNLKILAHDVQAKFKLPVEIGLKENSCSYKNKTSTINNFDILVYYFFAMLGLILVASTIYDLHFKCFSRNTRGGNTVLKIKIVGKKSNIFVAFSLYSNAKRLVSATSNKKEDNLSCLNGIKVLSCLWIVYGHVVLACFFYSKNPAYVVNEWKYSTKSTFTWSAFYAVDIFLTINGFLVTYIYLKTTDRLKITVIWFYLNRYLRVTPALVAAVLIHISVVKLLTDGSFISYNDGKFSQDCYNNWWTFFIHPMVFTNYDQIMIFVSKF